MEGAHPVAVWEGAVADAPSGCERLLRRERRRGCRLIVSVVCYSAILSGSLCSLGLSQVGAMLVAGDGNRGEEDDEWCEGGCVAAQSSAEPVRVRRRDVLLFKLPRRRIIFFGAVVSSF